MKKLVLFIMSVCVLFAGDVISEWKSNFEQTHTPFGETKNGRTFYYGEAIVNVSPSDPAFVKELVMGYEKAMLDMQANYILQTFGRESVKKIYEMFEDDSTNAQDFPPIQEANTLAKEGKIGVIVDKFLDVIENDLDKKLQEQGVPEDKIKKATIEQKKELFKESFYVKNIKKAYHSMQGLVPYKVKYATTTNSRGDLTRIAVIAVVSPKTIQFAKDIARKRATNVHGKPRKLDTLIPKSEDALMNEIGLRYTYDEQGRPMLISYGLWSVVLKTTNPVRYQKKLDLAQRKARLRAESYIGDFIKTRLTATETHNTGSLSKEIAKKITTLSKEGSESQESIEDIKETIDKYSKKFTAQSNFSLQGTREVRSWHKENPKNNLVYVGSVVTWTYKQLENAQGRKKVKKDRRSTHSSKGTVKVERESQEINDVEDF
jgi:hypothetical protein